MTTYQPDEAEGTIRICVVISAEVSSAQWEDDSGKGLTIRGYLKLESRK